MRRLGIVLMVLPLAAFSSKGSSAADGDIAPRVEGADPAEAEPTLEVFESLEARKRQLDAEAALIEQSKIDLKKLEDEVLQKIAQYQELIAEQKSQREALEKRIDEARGRYKDATLERFVAVSEKMPPESAASYIATLDENTASMILESMNVRKAAKVIAALRPSKAAQLSRMSLNRDPTRTNDTVAEPGEKR